MTPAPDRCGDLALTFGARAPGRSRTGTAWEPLHRAGETCLWHCGSDARWNGYPLAVRSDGPRTTVVLGDERDHWLAFGHDATDGSWQVDTDRFATLQAYRDVGTPMISTFSPTLWGREPPLDWEAISGFLTTGWYPGDRMPVDGVRVLRPATTLRFAADGSHRGERRHWDWSHDPSDEAPDLQVDRVAATLAAVLGARRDEVDRLGLPLSGGLDSRSTLAATTTPGEVADQRLRAFSYGYETGSAELAIAEELAACRGLDLHAVVIGPHLLDELDVVLDATEGLVDLAGCRQASVRTWLRDEVDAVVAAHWGDVWFGMSRARPDDDLAARLRDGSRRRGDRWLVDHVVAGRAPDPDESLRALFAEELERLPALSDPTMRAAALKTEQWSFRFTAASLRMHQAGADPVLPYYDPRVTDLALTLPVDLLTGRALQIDHLRRHAPDLAAVEWQAMEADLFALDRRRTTGLPRRVARGLYRRLRPPTAVLENWEIQFRGPETARWRDWATDSPAVADVVARGALDQAGVERILDAVERGDRDAGHIWSRLVTFCSWSDRFTR